MKLLIELDDDDHQFLKSQIGCRKLKALSQFLEVNHGQSLNMIAEVESLKRVIERLEYAVKYGDRLIPNQGKPI